MLKYSVEIIIVESKNGVRNNKLMKEMRKSLEYLKLVKPHYLWHKKNKVRNKIVLKHQIKPLNDITIL